MKRRWLGVDLIKYNGYYDSENDIYVLYYKDINVIPIFGRIDDSISGCSYATYLQSVKIRPETGDYECVYKM